MLHANRACGGSPRESAILAGRFSAPLGRRGMRRFAAGIRHPGGTDLPPRGCGVSPLDVGRLADWRCTPHSRPRKLHIARFHPTGENSLISLLVLFPRDPLRWARAGTLLVLPKENAPCTVEEKISAGLMESSSIAPQKRELNSPEIWNVSVASAARRASGGHFKLQQPTGRQRLKGFYQPLAAADWQLKERQSPKMRPRLGAPLQVPVLGAGAAHRTPCFRAHPPSGRERSEALARPVVHQAQPQTKKVSFGPSTARFL